MKFTQSSRPLLLTAVALSTLVPAFARAQPPADPAAEAPASHETPAPPPAEESPAAGDGEGRVLPQRFADWLREVEPLITVRERTAFLALGRDHQREAFIRRFWESRDPYPQTPRNERRDRWRDRLAVARSRFGSLEDGRARVFLVHGVPNSGFEVRCTTTRVPAEVWAYSESDELPFGFLVVFLRPEPDEPARVFRGGGGLRRVLTRARRCLNGTQLLEIAQYIENPANEYLQKLAHVLAKPGPESIEWLDTFDAHSTDVPEEAERFDASLEVGFPGRRQSRTAVQGVVSVPPGEIEPMELSGHRSYELVVNGEIVTDGSLLDSFRYQYGFPVSGFDEAPLPLAFQRFVRPGTYRLLLRVEDLASGRFYRHEREIEVPAREELLPPPPPGDPEVAALFRQATEAMERGETSLRIVPPRGALQTGFVRVSALATGDEIEKVRFVLDGEPVLVKNRPPFDVSLDMGEFPQRHRLRVEGLDAEGREVARDSIELNTGANRFAVRLVEPRRGGEYTETVSVEARVDVPRGRSVDRVELWIDDDRMATLHQPPWVQTLPLPAGEEISYVRAVAYLPDGNSTEDLVFVNSPDFDRVDVQMVELYTTVLDRRGRPVEGLDEEDFRVFEDEVPQEIRRFAKVEDLPIHAGILIDNSGSMRDQLPAVRSAALSFLEQAITPKDRAAVISFNKFPHLAVKLTNDLAKLGGGLAGLAPEGETALYDSLIFALYYFTGVRGQRAVLLLSDGRDEGSEFSYDEAVEYARRAGVTIYTIGLDLPHGAVRGRLATLAEETGGRSFFVRDVSELAEIYDSIEEELRSQYLIAYQSSNTGDSPGFRSVELEVETDRPAEVHTISGYYP